MNMEEAKTSNPEMSGQGDWREWKSESHEPTQTHNKDGRHRHAPATCPGWQTNTQRIGTWLQTFHQVLKVTFSRTDGVVEANVSAVGVVTCPEWRVVDGALWQAGRKRQQKHLPHTVRLIKGSRKAQTPSGKKSHISSMRGKVRFYNESKHLPNKLGESSIPKVALICLTGLWLFNSRDGPRAPKDPKCHGSCCVSLIYCEFHNECLASVLVRK